MNNLCDIPGCENEFRYSVQFEPGEFPDGADPIQHQCEAHHSNTFVYRVRTRSERGDMLDWWLSGSSYGLDSETQVNREDKQRAEHNMHDGWSRE